MPHRVGLCPEHADEFYMPLDPADNDAICPQCDRRLCVYSPETDVAKLAVEIVQLKAAVCLHKHARGPLFADETDEALYDVCEAGARKEQAMQMTMREGCPNGNGRPVTTTEQVREHARRLGVELEDWQVEWVTAVLNCEPDGITATGRRAGRLQALRIASGLLVERHRREK